MVRQTVDAMTQVCVGILAVFLWTFATCVIAIACLSLCTWERMTTPRKTNASTSTDAPMMDVDVCVVVQPGGNELALVSPRSAEE